MALLTLTWVQFGRKFGKKGLEKERWTWCVHGREEDDNKEEQDTVRIDTSRMSSALVLSQVEARRQYCREHVRPVRHE